MFRKICSGQTRLAHAQLIVSQKEYISTVAITTIIIITVTIAITIIIILTTTNKLMIITTLLPLSKLLLSLLLLLTM